MMYGLFHGAQAACGGAAAPVRAVDILAHQHFFTSPKLASMATQAEILSKVGGRAALRCITGGWAGPVWIGPPAAPPRPAPPHSTRHCCSCAQRGELV